MYRHCVNLCQVLLRRKQQLLVYQVRCFLQEDLPGLILVLIAWPFNPTSIACSTDPAATSLAAHPFPSSCSIAVRSNNRITITTYPVFQSYQATIRTSNVNAVQVATLAHLVSVHLEASSSYHSLRDR
jgi:hypothetical protein